MHDPIISILICSLYKRFGMLARLLGNLEYQIREAKAFDLVEVCVNADGGEKSTGRKRNELLQQAKGKYVVYVDDDDIVSEKYIQQLLIAAESDTDCFAISGIMFTNGEDLKNWYISKDNPYCTCFDEHKKEYYLRYPNHITPIRASIAKQFSFPDKTFAEDFEWATQIHLSRLIKTEFKIEHHPMYIYNFSSNKK